MRFRRKEFSMKSGTTRRTAIAAAAGLAVATALPLRSGLAAISSGAGVVAGGSLEGPGGTIQFSAFGSRLEIAGDSDLVEQGAIAWYDPAGLDGQPLTLALVSVESYGPLGVDLPNARRLTGTVSVNGEGEHPFALQVEDFGEIGVVPDTVHLAVGGAVATMTGTPVPAEDAFSYEIEGELATGDVQLIDLS
jgi:hypothetical protein